MLSWNDKSVAIQIIDEVRSELKDEMQKKNEIPPIVPSIKKYVDQLQSNSATKKIKTVQHKIDTIVEASIFDCLVLKMKLLKFFNLRDKNYEQITTNSLDYNCQQKKRKDYCYDMAKKCVNEWVHGEEVNRIDTNQFKFHEVSKQEKHPYSIWNTVYWYQRFNQFVSRDIYAKYRSRNHLLTVSRTRFLELICPCIKEPKAHSCVNIPMTALSELMLVLKNFFLFNPEFNSKICSCDCALHNKYKNFEDNLKKKPEELIELTLCSAKRKSKLLNDGKIPKMFCPSCVDSCSECGVDSLYLDLCPVWNKCEEVVAEIVWEESARAGGKTQLEPVEKDL